MGVKKLLKGLQNIRTLSGKVAGKSSPYLAYMKMSCLEMEKFRRGKEKESALERVKNIEARFREIDTEKASILATLNKPQDPSAIRREAGQGPDRARQAGAFRVRY